VKVAQLAPARHAASKTIVQSVGQWPPVGSSQDGPLHWQQSFVPGVFVALAVGVGVKVAQFAPPRHAAWKTMLQSVGQLPSVGSWHAGPLHWQQSFTPGVFVAVAAGVGVKVAQSAPATQAAWKTMLQSVGQLPSVGSWHAGPLHWQQSFAPGVFVGLIVGVGVKVAQFAPPRHAAWKTMLQSVGQLPSVGSWHAGPVHWQQSFGPGVGVVVAVWVGVNVMQFPLAHAASKTILHSVGQ